MWNLETELLPKSMARRGRKKGVGLVTRQVEAAVGAVNGLVP
jgi:hypothetical protein